MTTRCDKCGGTENLGKPSATWNDTKGWHDSIWCRDCMKKFVAGFSKQGKETK